MRRIYLDYASTTPLDKKVFKAMLPFLKKEFGNPSALYKEGIRTKEAVRESRKSIAELLNVRSEEIVFTASGTEADNMALIGVYEAFKDKCTPHFITTTIEHPGILETMRWLEKQGAEVTYVPVEENGIVNPAKIKAALKPTTVLVSIMLANNEIGTIQPIREISRMIAEYSKIPKNNALEEHGYFSAEKFLELAPSRSLASSQASFSGISKMIPYLHTDASQAGNYLDLSFQKLGVDMMTLDASKVYGPKGIGLLAVKKHVAINPIIYGGGQERGMRAGTENVPAIVGFAHALVIAQSMKEKESARLSALRDYFFDSVIKEIPNILINGDRTERLPNNINICIPSLDAEFAVIKLDTVGISCSAASSCLNLSENSYSYVIEALENDSDSKEKKLENRQGKKCRESSLRFSLGRATTRAEIVLTLKKLRAII